MANIPVTKQIFTRLLNGIPIFNGGNPPTALKVNYTASVDPTHADNGTAGWQAGSVWVNTASTPVRVWVCQKANSVAGIWKPIEPKVYQDTSSTANTINLDLQPELHPTEYLPYEGMKIYFRLNNNLTATALISIAGFSAEQIRFRSFDGTTSVLQNFGFFPFFRILAAGAVYCLTRVSGVWLIDFSGNFAIPSETTAGQTRTATQAEVNSGVNDLAAVTPLKLASRALSYGNVRVGNASNIEILSQGPLGKRIYVSQSGGTDTRGSMSKYNRFFPFASLTTAQNAGASGDLVWVLDGTFNEHTLGKNGLNWMFEQGTVIDVPDTNATGVVSGARHIFGLPSSNTSYSIYGYLRAFHTAPSSAPTTTTRIIHMPSTFTNSYIYAECDEMSARGASSVDSAGIRVDGGNSCDFRGALFGGVYAVDVRNNSGRVTISQNPRGSCVLGIFTGSLGGGYVVNCDTRLGFGPDVVINGMTNAFLFSSSLGFANVSNGALEIYNSRTEVFSEDLFTVSSTGSLSPYIIVKDFRSNGNKRLLMVTEGSTSGAGVRLDFENVSMEQVGDTAFESIYINRTGSTNGVKRISGGILNNRFSAKNFVRLSGGATLGAYGVNFTTRQRDVSDPTFLIDGGSTLAMYNCAIEDHNGAASPTYTFSGSSTGSVFFGTDHWGRHQFNSGNLTALGASYTQIP